MMMTMVSRQVDGACELVSLCRMSGSGIECLGDDELAWPVELSLSPVA